MNGPPARKRLKSGSRFSANACTPSRASSDSTKLVVCPGPTKTAFLERIAGEGGEQLVESLTRAVPMRRLGEPEDAAAAVAFLASDAAGYITRQTLSVSGGLTMA